MARKLKKGDRFLAEVVFTGEKDSDGDYVFSIEFPNMKGGDNEPYDFLQDTVYVHESAVDKLVPIDEYNLKVAEGFTPDKIEAYLNG